MEGTFGMKGMFGVEGMFGRVRTSGVAGKSGLVGISGAVSTSCARSVVKVGEGTDVGADDLTDCGMMCGMVRAAVISGKGSGSTIRGIIREIAGLGITGEVTARVTVTM